MSMKLNLTISVLGERAEYALSIDDATPLATEPLDDYVAKIESAAQLMYGRGDRQAPVASEPAADATPYMEIARLDLRIIELEDALKAEQIASHQLIRQQRAIDKQAADAALQSRISDLEATLKQRAERIDGLAESIGSRDSLIADLSTQAAKRVEELLATIRQRDERIASIRETMHAQDQCINDLKNQLVQAKVFIAAEPPISAVSIAAAEVGELSLAEPAAVAAPPAKTNGKPAKEQRKASPTPSISSLSKPALPRLGWDDFNKLVLSELKRLAPTPGTMCGYKIWDEMRNPNLPTMLAVIRRYGCSSAPELATKLDMEPPLGRQQIVSVEDVAEAEAADGDGAA